MKSKLLLIAVILALGILFSVPIITNLQNWGTHDWDQHFAFHEAARKSIVEYGQFPLWNPWMCGGNLLLANPQSTFLNPAFVFVLLFGTVIGMKLIIIFYLVLGMLGMYLVARFYGAGKLSSFIAPIIFMLSSTYALRASMGHSVWLTLGLVPFVFLFFLKSIKKWKMILIAAVFNCLIFFGGGIYPLVFGNLFIAIYALLDGIFERRKKAFVMVIVLIVITMLFGAVKLIPFYNFSSQFAVQQDDVQETSIGILYDSLFSRNQLPTSRIYESSQGLQWGWHEYGHYIGFVVFIISLAGAILLFKKKNVKKLVFSILIFTLLALGNATPFNIWALLHKLPLLSSLHGSFRALFVVMLCISILAAMMLTVMEKKTRIFKINAKLVVILIIAVILVDLYLVSSPIYRGAFPKEPMAVLEEESFVQVYSTDPTRLQYRNMLQNWGTVNCYERISPLMASIAMFRDDKVVSYDNYVGESYLLGTKEKQEITYFSPNRIVVNVEADNPDSLILNQNYYKGWKAAGKDVLNKENLIAAEVSESGNVVFSFMPLDYIVGLIISLISIVAAIIIYLKK